MSNSARDEAAKMREPPDAVVAAEERGDELQHEPEADRPIGGKLQRNAVQEQAPRSAPADRG